MDGSGAAPVPDSSSDVFAVAGITPRSQSEIIGAGFHLEISRSSQEQLGHDIAIQRQRQHRSALCA
jgi:hypothetical protein